MHQSSNVAIDGETVKGSPLGEELSDAQSAALADIVTTRVLAEGEFLLREGHRDDALHVIVEGKLEVVKSAGGGDWVSLHILHGGDMAGELGFIDGQEHSAALRAVSGCKVFSLKRDDFEGLLHRDPELVYKVMRAITRTVHGILRRMNTQYVELTNYISKQHGRY
jgi:CRP-like cAMP-binding protein